LTLSGDEADTLSRAHGDGISPSVRSSAPALWIGFAPANGGALGTVNGVF
jgi:hypothetical protein